jgi:signal transduction histidine kinase
MRRSSESFSPFFGTTLGLMVILVAAFVFLGLRLQQREIDGARSFLAQRVFCCFIAGSGKAAAGDRKEVRSASYCWRAIDDLVLLRDGGSYAGLPIVPITEPELKELLDAALALKARVRPAESQNPAGKAAAEEFRRKIKALSDALVFQAANSGRGVWLAFWILFLTSALFLATGISYLLNCRWQRSRLDKRLELFTLRAALLRNLPEAWFLLDRELILQDATDMAAACLGAGPGSGVRFDHLCRDQEHLSTLRQVTGEIELYPVGRVQVTPERVALEGQSGGRCREVVISWFRVILAGSDYLLGRISDAETGFLESTDSLAASRLQELAEKFFTVQDEERRLLADELHDGLCQALAVLKMQVSAVERRVGDEELKEECRQARRYVTQIIEDVRRLSHDLSPVILDDLGLSEALVHLVNNFTATHNIKALTSVPDIDDCFSENEARNIYRIVQEAINNVGKHAKASQMVIEVEPDEGEIHFLIRDDGVGFDASGFNRQPLKAGLGMASMAQRVQLMGGEFRVTSRPGQGTEIKFTLPKSCRPGGGRFT